MVGEKRSIFDRYPSLRTLQGKVPDEVVENEAGPKAEQFEHYQPLAHEKIPTVRLCDVFPTELEKGRITLENFLGQWGNIAIEELCKICLIAKWLQPRSIFEIGTYNGMTTLQMAMNTPKECQIYTLDVDPESPEAATLEIGEIDRCLAQKLGAFSFEVGNYFKGTPYADRITQLWGDSTKFNMSPYTNSMDIVYVDAGHTYDYIKADTESALKLIRQGGIIFWHDYNQVLHPDVTRCLYEYALAGMPLYHLRGTQLVVCYQM